MRIFIKLWKLFCFIITHITVITSVTYMLKQGYFNLFVANINNLSSLNLTTKLELMLIGIAGIILTLAIVFLVQSWVKFIFKMIKNFKESKKKAKVTTYVPQQIG